MYPHPELHSFIQDCSPCVPKKILNKSIEKGMVKIKDVYTSYPSRIFRTITAQPECFAPHVDVTRAPLAYGERALPKLKKELSSPDPLIVRQAITTLGDLLVNPEKCIEAVRLRIPDKIAEFLISEDGYLRERAALLHVIMGNQPAGRMAIVANCVAIQNLFDGLDDQVVPVRYKMAQAIEALAQEGQVADEFCKNKYVKTITSKLLREQRHILLVFLYTLDSLLRRGCEVKLEAVQGDTFDYLVKLLERKDEEITVLALGCISVLCEHIKGKEKADDMDLMSLVYKYIKDCQNVYSASIKAEAGRLSTFITVTTRGKLKFLESGLMTTYLLLASGKCCCSSELLLFVIKALTNVAEAPQARREMCEKHYELIENIETGCELLQRHKQILLEVIRWKP